MNKIKDVVLALQHLLGNLCSLLQQFLQLWLWDLCVAAPEDPNLGVLVHRTTFPKVIKTFPQQGQRFPCTAPGPHCFLWEAKGTHGTVDRGFSHLEFSYGCSHRCNLLSSLCLMNAGGAWLSCCQYSRSCSLQRGRNPSVPLCSLFHGCCSSKTKHRFIAKTGRLG